jgi:hypothetical protein
MGLVVTGISPTADLSALEAALRAADLPTDHIQLIEPGEGAAPLAHGTVVAPTVGGGIETGTGVPGLTSGNMSVTAREYFRDETLGDRLGDLEIPDDEIDNYLEALAAGRSIVAYFAKDDTIDRVEGAFRAAGIAKVKRF